MPFTAITFLIGCLAISGIPPFAGFWSKDEILGSAFAKPVLCWLLPLNYGFVHVPDVLQHV